jgi:hypothetical protein
MRNEISIVASAAAQCIFGFCAIEHHNLLESYSMYANFLPSQESRISLHESLTCHTFYASFCLRAIERKGQSLI